MLFRLSLAVVLLATTACGRRSSGDDFEDPAEYESIEIDPPQATLSVALGGTATQDYVVNGVFEGKRTDITQLCALSIDATFGTFADATVTVGPRGGKTTVSAACGTVGATAQLAINLTGSVVTPGTPANAAGLFTAATAGTDANRTPTIQYPIDKAVSPRNIPPIEVQYAAAATTCSTSR